MQTHPSPTPSKSPARTRKSFDAQEVLFHKQISSVKAPELGQAMPKEVGAIQWLDRLTKARISCVPSLTASFAYRVQELTV